MQVAGSAGAHQREGIQRRRAPTGAQCTAVRGGGVAGRDDGGSAATRVQATRAERVLRAAQRGVDRAAQHRSTRGKIRLLCVCLNIYCLRYCCYLQSRRPLARVREALFLLLFYLVGGV
jgi:hypothetical protein